MVNTLGTLPPRARYAYDEIPVARPRRIVFFAKAKRHTRVTAHFIRGFEENGHRVLWIHFSKIRQFVGSAMGRAWVLWRLGHFRPDYILIYHQDIPLEVLDRLPGEVTKAQFYEDVREAPDPHIVRVARACDFFFTTARGQAPVFEKLGGCKAFYLGTGCDRTDHYPVEPDPAHACDVTFIGSPYTQERRELIPKISERFSLNLYGKQWKEQLGISPVKREIFPDDYRQICASAKILIGSDRRADCDHYFSNRTWLTLGCGGFLLTRYVPNLEETFANGEHLVWWKTHAECLERIEYYLSRDDERGRIARAGCEYVRKYHTFKHATAELNAWVMGEPWG